MIKSIIFIIFLLYFWAFWIEPNLIVIKKYNAFSLHGKKIVFVSDFHIAKLEKLRLKRIVSLINKQKPDIVISGGDYIKGHTGSVTLPIEEQAKILNERK